MIRRLRNTGGFTIVEVIVVLTITIALLASSLALFTNRVPRTQFSSAVNDLAVRIDDATSQVVTGYYPSGENFDCTGATLDDSTPGDFRARGQDEDCIYLGQAIQFGARNGSGGVCPESRPAPDVDCDRIVFYSVFGSREKSGGGAATSLAESRPKIAIDLAQASYVTGYGLHVTKVTYDGGDVGGVALLQTFGSSVNDSGEPEGSPQVQLVPLDGTTVGQETTIDLTSFPGFLNASVTDGFYSTPKPQTGVTICLASASTEQFATITIGRNGTLATTDKEIFEGTPPAICT